MKGQKKKMNQFFTYQISNQLILIILSFILGLLPTLVISKTSRLTNNMLLTLSVLPPIVCTALLAVNGELGVSIAIMGVFSLVRFRSVPGTSKDIINVFLAMVVGLVTSTGYICVALAITFILSMIILLCSSLIKNSDDKYELKIVVPENMNFEDIFDEILSKYFDSNELIKVKTTNMGSLFELSYSVYPKNNINKKELIDEVRSHNGNLTVAYYKVSKEEVVL
jgi:hypothetical protein